MEPLSRFLLAYGAYVAAVNLVDGPWKQWEKGQWVDAWTLTHVAWGVIAERMGLSLEQITALAVLNEVGEAVIRRNRSDLAFGSPESPANIAVDVGTTVGAWAASRELTR